MNASRSPFSPHFPFFSFFPRSLPCRPCRCVSGCGTSRWWICWSRRQRPPRSEMLRRLPSRLSAPPVPGPFDHASLHRAHQDGTEDTELQGCPETQKRASFQDFSTVGSGLPGLEHLPRAQVPLDRLMTRESREKPQSPCFPASVPFQARPRRDPPRPHARSQTAWFAWSVLRWSPGTAVATHEVGHLVDMACKEISGPRSGGCEQTRESERERDVRCILALVLDSTTGA